MRLRAAALGAIALSAVVLAACSDESPEATATPPPTEAATTTTTPTPPASTPTAAAAIEATRAPGGSQLTGVIASPYDTFHYVATIDVGVVDDATDAVFGGRVEGDYVTPDRHSFRNEFGFLGLTFSTDSIVIGRDAWAREGLGPWSATTIEALLLDGTIDLSSMDPEFIGFDREAADGFGSMVGEPETINGVETVRYTLDKELYAAISPFLDDAPTGDLDVSEFDELSTTLWMDRDTQAIVRMELFMTAPAAVMGDDLGVLGIAPSATISMTMTFDMTRINDDSITVEAPLP